MVNDEKKQYQGSRSWDDILAERLVSDPEFRACWERTAFARALSIEVIRKRAQLGINQEELSERLGVNLEAIFQLEDGEEDPSLEMLNLLSEKLGIEFDVAVTLKKPTSPDTKVSVLHVELGRHADVA